jgi:ribonuclease-3
MIRFTGRQGIAERDYASALMMEKVASILGLPADSPYLVEALTHPSYANENRLNADNQRLEFLGDAVLGLCVSELLYARFAEADEGALTQLRAQLVNTQWLADWGRRVGLSDALRLGHGAQVSGLQDSTNVVADAVEACVAAVYLDSGLEAARRVCADIVQPAMDRPIPGSHSDPKSELQRVVQGLGLGLPAYEVIEIGGPAHERWFDVRVGVGGTWLASGRGRSKRAAERAAAALVLNQRDTLLAPFLQVKSALPRDS